MTIPFNTQIMSWQVDQPRGKLRGFEQHLFDALHFSQQVAKMQSTSHRLVLIDINLEHNAFLIDILFEGVVLKFIVCSD
jgi:hypothetical protein